MQELYDAQGEWGTTHPFLGTDGHGDLPLLGAGRARVVSVVVLHTKRPLVVNVPGDQMGRTGQPQAIPKFRVAQGSQMDEQQSQEVPIGRNS